MIRKVRFSNFYSFYKEQEINFLANKKKTYDYYTSKSGEQITKIAGFIGGNASGKTNVMRLFSFFSHFVCRKTSEEPALIKDIAYKTFFNSKEKSDFYIEFEKNDSIFYYDFSIKNNVIIKESLSVRQIEKNAREIIIFARQSNTIKLLNNNYFTNLSIDTLPKIREDVSFIAFIKQSPYSIDIINIVYDYFLGFKTNINEKGQLNNLAHQFKTLDIYLNDNDVKKGMEDFICRFDGGLN